MTQSKKKKKQSEKVQIHPFVQVIDAVFTHSVTTSVSSLWQSTAHYLILESIIVLPCPCNNSS